MLRVPVKKGNLSKALKLFKRKFKNTQTLKELRERQSYTKKSKKRRLIKNNLNKALKLFKRKFKNTGVLKELRDRKQYTKKSTKKRLIKNKAIYKQKYLNNTENE